MIPAFSIASNGKDYSNTYRQRMVSLKVSEDAGEHSDTFEVELADTDGKVPIPVKGEILTVSLKDPPTSCGSQGRRRLSSQLKHSNLFKAARHAALTISPLALLCRKSPPKLD